MEVQNRLEQLIQLYRFIAGYEKGRNLKKLVCDVRLDIKLLVYLALVSTSKQLVVV